MSRKLTVKKKLDLAQKNVTSADGSQPESLPNEDFYKDLYEKLYDIHIERDFDGLEEALKPFNLGERRVCIITDSHVAPCYLGTVYAIVQRLCRKTVTFSFEAGEEHKNLDTISRMYQTLIYSHFDRNDMLIALGGGVTGDMTGFCAATYLRGIRFVQLPTSLLSQVDSSIGGKTGVDFLQFKNMVGAFYQPSLVYINISTLNTLPARQFSSGMGEVIKHGLIQDRSYYEWLIEKQTAILALESDVLEEMIFRSCQIKQRVVEEDPTEQGLRAILNFGHTIGHAVEKLSDFQELHGECVGIGMAAAGMISLQKGNITQEEYKQLLLALKMFGLPFSLDTLSSQEIVETTANDKKMDSGQIRFILLQSIGEAYIDRSVTREQMHQACDLIHTPVEKGKHLS